MSDCADCHAAARSAVYGCYTTSCLICAARHIARDPVCAEAKRRGVITDAYRGELEHAAGKLHWMVVHDLVRAWQRGERPEVPI